MENEDIVTEIIPAKKYAEKSDIKKILNRLTKLEGRINYLIQKVGELHHHTTQLHAIGKDIENLPPATGHLDLIQRASLRLAKMLDADLRAAGINYFLSAGSLLGAARNGKFIPWDDDIDFGLMRNDFERAVELLSKKYNSGWFSTKWGVSGGIFKVLFMNRICVDLFPWDTYYKRIDNPEDAAAFRARYRIAMDEARKWERGESNYNHYTDISDDIIMHGNAPIENGDIFEGIDWQLMSERAIGHYHNALWRNEYILPYGEIEFCGHKFMAPANPDAWLTTRYGDWSTFNPEFGKHIKKKLTYQELDILNAFINGTIQWLSH